MAHVQKHWIVCSLLRVDGWKQGKHVTGEIQGTTTVLRSSVARASLLRDFDNHRFTVGHGVKDKAEAAEGASGVGTFEMDRSRFISAR